MMRILLTLNDYYFAKFPACVLRFSRRLKIKLSFTDIDA
jgi:hypothetical protein